MTDREKVISDVISAFDDWENNRCCPGEDWSDVHQSRDMVIALLKAQEPVKPKYDPDDDDWAHCGHCGARLYERWVGANYCAFCGHEVKWDD